MTITRLRLGKRGEDEATAILKRARYRILERNYRCRSGEIDIIAVESGALVFIEVKTRSGRGFGSPQEAVDYRKQGKIIRASMEYLSYVWTGPEPDVRYDVVSIEPDDGLKSGFRVEIIKAAFSADGF